MELKDRIEMLRGWLTRWLGKSVSCGPRMEDDWFCRSAFMAYQHFVDLVAEEYAGDNKGVCHSLYVEFGSSERGTDDEVAIDLERQSLCIRFMSLYFSYRYELEFGGSKNADMDWRVDERGVVIQSDSSNHETVIEIGFKEMLEMFNGGEKRWFLQHLRIYRQGPWDSTRRQILSYGCPSGNFMD